MAAVLHLGTVLGRLAFALTLVGAAAAASAEPEGPAAPLAGPLGAWDGDGVPVPFDRCPDAGEAGEVDADGCPLPALRPLGDVDGDRLLDLDDVFFAPDDPRADALRRARIVHTDEGGRVRFFGERTAGTDPRDPNSDRHDLLADGAEVALRRGLSRAADGDGRLVQPEGAKRADPRAPDDWMEVVPIAVGGRVFWNAALEAGLRQVVADDLAPEGDATYAPPAVRLHAWVLDPVESRDREVSAEEVSALLADLDDRRARLVTRVVVAPFVAFDGQHVAGLSYGDVVLVAVAHKGFDACEAEGGAPGTPACDRLAELFRWTLNHERFHRFGLLDRAAGECGPTSPWWPEVVCGGDDLMSTAPGVLAPRPHESAARFAWIEAHQGSLVRRL